MNRVPLIDPILRATNPASFGRGATVFVVERGGGEEDQIPVYSAETGGSKLSQPLTGDDGGLPKGAGDVIGWVDPGSYDRLIDGQRVPWEASAGDISEEVTALLGSVNALIYKGILDCSANPKYPAASAGDTYMVSVAGKVGGASGTSVEVGDLLVCNTDGTAEGTQAGVGAKWNVIEGKTAALAAVKVEQERAETAETAKLAKAENLKDLASAASARTNLGLGTAATQASTAFDAAGAAASEETRAKAVEATKADLEGGVLKGSQVPPSVVTDSEMEANGKGFINHGAVANTARPAGFASIEWLGSVEPEHAINGDTWIEG